MLVCRLHEIAKQMNTTTVFRTHSAVLLRTSNLPLGSLPLTNDNYLTINVIDFILYIYICIILICMHILIS